MAREWWDLGGHVADVTGIEALGGVTDAAIGLIPGLNVVHGLGKSISQGTKLANDVSNAFAGNQNQAPANPLHANLAAGANYMPPGQMPAYAQKASALPDATVGRLQNLHGAIGGRQNPYQLGGELYKLARDNAHADIQGRYANLAGALQNPTSPAQAKALRQIQMGAASEMSRASSGLSQRLAELGANWQGQQDSRMIGLEGLMQSGYGQAFNQFYDGPMRELNNAVAQDSWETYQNFKPMINENQWLQLRGANDDARFDYEMKQVPILGNIVWRALQTPGGQQALGLGLRAGMSGVGG